MDKFTKFSVTFLILVTINFTSLAQQNIDTYQHFPNSGKSITPIAWPVNLPYRRILNSPITDYILITADSGWAKEYNLKFTELNKDGFHYLQKAGRTSAGIKPWFIIYNKKTNHGISLLLAYPGNWKLDIQPEKDRTKIHIRTSPQALPKLQKVKSMPIPGALLSEFSGHFDYAAIPIKKFIRKNLSRQLPNDWPLIQYNDYYATFGKFDENLLIKAARNAAQIGCEVFTIDCGWYGSHENWNILGDWTVNKNKLPKGLEPVINTVRNLGMKFGLWIEIESANKDSKIAKQHPDWMLPDTAMLGDRHTLNFGKNEVLEYAKSIIDRLMKDYNLDYIKMDYNTNPSKGSEKYIGAQDPIYNHYQGLLKLWKYMRKKYPHLIIENCSSGSLRHDASTAAFTDTHWTSDNIQNKSNLAINYGATLLFPPETCSDWTVFPQRTEENNALDTPSRFTINMTGHLGLSGKIWQWSEQTKKIAAEKIAQYKKIRQFIKISNVYHLTPQPDYKNPDSVMALQYNTPNSECLMFVFHANAPELTAQIKLRELKPETTYQITFPDSFNSKQITAKGNLLTQKGIKITFPQKASSAIIKIIPLNQ